MRSAPLVTLLGLATLAASAGGVRAEVPCRAGSVSMARVELFFGAGNTGVGAWRHFVAEVVTPRFPDGLTSFEAFGQWRNARGSTAEATRVLVIFYRQDATSEDRIEAIRALYKRRFSQMSVLRADTSACVAF